MEVLTEMEIDLVSGGNLDDVYTLAAFTTAGAAIGFLIAGPIGAAAGAASGFGHGAIVVAASHS